jgi:hypothetical protein
MSSIPSLPPTVFATHVKQSLFTDPMSPRELRYNEDALAYAESFLARMQQALPGTLPIKGKEFLMAFIVVMDPRIASSDPSNPDLTGMLETSQSLVDTTKDVIEYILERELDSFDKLPASVSEEFFRNHETFKNVLQIWKRNEIERGMAVMLNASRIATERYRQFMAQVWLACLHSGFSIPC